MSLPEAAPEHATMDPKQIESTFALAEKYGFSFLTPQETAARLPLFKSSSNQIPNKT